LKSATEQALLNRGNDSHLELRPAVWHPSQLAPLPECPRSALNRKLNLEEETIQQQGIFQSGTNHHTWIKDEVAAYVDGPAYYERPLRMGYDMDAEKVIHRPADIVEADIRVVGRCDVFDPVNNVVLDVKSTGSTAYDSLPNTRYPADYFNDPENHQDYPEQLQVYMAALGADAGRLMYTHKMDLVPMYYPQNDTIAYDPDRLAEVMDAAYSITQMLHGYTDDRDRVQVDRLMADGHPFDKCGRKKCWGCKYENLKAFNAADGHAPEEDA
jgi:hypothetical protein